MGENILELQNLRAWYSQGKNVLSGFSLQLRPHEVVGLIGLNGAGKTTFLKTLSGLHEGFRCDGIRLNGQTASFRDKGFKLRRYTVFAEDNSFQYFTFRSTCPMWRRHTKRNCPTWQNWCGAFTLRTTPTPC